MTEFLIPNTKNSDLISGIFLPFLAMKHFVFYKYLYSNVGMTKWNPNGKQRLEIELSEVAPLIILVPTFSPKLL